MSAPEYTGRAALNLALDRALAADFRVFLLGRNLADPVGGRYGVTRGLSTAHGSHRVVDVPPSVAAMCGAAVGAALEGMVPVVELPAAPVGGAVLDQLAQVRVFQEPKGAYGGSPVFRVPVPAPEMGLDAQLDRFARIPGLRIVQPTTPADAESLLLAAIQDPAPSVVLEPVRLYDTIGPRTDPAGRGATLAAAALAVRAADTTVVTCGVARAAALHAAADLTAEGVEVDVVVLRGLESLDTEAALRSVARTRRLVLAAGTAEARLRCRDLADLAGRELLGRLSAPAEHARAVDAGELRPADIAAAVRTVCGYSRSRAPGR
jgi:pyruvate/2-oxoglutarate/acetoin dehydrogenase E1 component